MQALFNKELSLENHISAVKIALNLLGFCQNSKFILKFNTTNQQNLSYVYSNYYFKYPVAPFGRISKTRFGRYFSNKLTVNTIRLDSGYDSRIPGKRNAIT